MIYPSNYEQKIGFTEIRGLLKGRCLSTMGKEKVDAIEMTTEIDEVRRALAEVSEFRAILSGTKEFPMQFFFDVRESIKRIRLAGTHLEENEVWDLRRSLDTITQIVTFLNATEGEAFVYPHLQRMTEGVATFPAMVRRIDSILDKFGHIKDSASMTLAGIRHELKKMEGSISRTLYSILHSAQRDGLVDKDVAPTLRDGRLVIPVAPAVKKRINGIVHDESATGKTVFIEPAEVVEANNHVRQLEAEERREIIRILTVFTDEVRPQAHDILSAYDFLAAIDLIQAKAQIAITMKAVEPQLTDGSHIDWIQAVHPLLALALEKQEKKVVPLDIILNNVQRLLIISGPNAGGKSVCLKTVGLLQYMLQCGLSVPMTERSTCGIFRNIMIDIGDEQSIDDDLSTYSSHLLNMKQMMRWADGNTLLLIDEFGGGTEPTIGGAIAEAVLRQFWRKKAFGVITTHYQNLKLFADGHEGVVNGAMLYDRHEMKALFQLSIGQPGSSFAIEIARKTGLPEEVISEASEIVGSEYIKSDKYLQDIVRDKRYWEGKRQTIHQHEKRLEARGEKLETDIEEIERERKAILRRAKEQAEELLKETNKRIEQTIREIREQQAEKEATKKLREEMEQFKAEVSSIDSKANDEMIERKMRQILERRERKAQRKEKKAQEAMQASSAPTPQPQAPATTKSLTAADYKPGDMVRIKGLQSIGEVKSSDGKTLTILLGGMLTKMAANKVEPAKGVQRETSKQEQRNESIAGAYAQLAKNTRTVIDNRRSSFRQDLDVRGLRGDEAVNTVMHFIDDAILVGMSRVRILHGTGTGILRQLIRQYLATVPNVAHFQDEHVQFGGAGITVVDIE